MIRPTVSLLSPPSSSSKTWLSRQFRDPYVKKRLSSPSAYRSRSAFKLLEIDDRFGGFLGEKDVKSVVDLGGAPGGWSQVVAGKMGWDPTPEEDVGYLKWKGKDKGKQANMGTTWSDSSSANVLGARTRHLPRLQSKEYDQEEPFDPLSFSSTDLASIPPPKGRGTIIAVDLLNIAPIHGVQTVLGDFMLPSTRTLVQGLLLQGGEAQGKADVILSDMATNATGNQVADTEASLEICEAVFDFAAEHLRTAEEVKRRKGGVLLMKFFAHPLLDSFRASKLKPNFHHVYYVKPGASRQESKEGYFLCMGYAPNFKGGP